MRLGPEYRIGTKLLKDEVAYEIVGISKLDGVIKEYILKDKNGNKSRVTPTAIASYTKVR